MKTKEYEVIANLCIECNPDLMTDIRDSIMDKIIQVVEHYNAFVGGGIELKEVTDE